MRWPLGAREDDEGSALPWPQESRGGGRLRPPHPWPALAPVMFSSCCVCRKCANSAKSGLGWARARGWVAAAGRAQGGAGAPASIPTQGSNLPCPWAAPPLWPGAAGAVPDVASSCNLSLETPGQPLPGSEPPGGWGLHRVAGGRQQPPGGPEGRRAEPEAAPSPPQAQPAGRTVVAVVWAGFPAHDEPLRGLVQPQGAALCPSIHPAAVP